MGEEAMPELDLFGVPWPEFNSGILYKNVVPKSLQDCTLLEYYCSMYEDSAPKLGWVHRIKNGQIAVDNAVVTTTNFKLRAGARLVYHRLPWREPFAPFKLQVLYEDEDILAVNKPSGLQVLPGGLFQQRTVLSQLQWRLSGQAHECLLREETDTQPSPVHRLGRGTSGVLLCAKSQIARTKLASDFTFDSISNVSNRNNYTRRRKPSQSNVRVLRRNKENNSTLIEVEILTGRPHQIRIHLAYLGHPLLGDELYVAGGQPRENAWNQSAYDSENIAHDGGFKKPINALPGDCGYYLHAYQIKFHHPITNKVMTITAEPSPLLRIDVASSS